MSQALASLASSRPRLSARFGSGSTSLERPSEAASALSSAGGRPRLEPGKSVNTIAEARSPSSATKPFGVLVAGQRDDRHARAGKIGPEGEVAQYRSEIERHVRAVQHDRQPLGPDIDIEALHAPGETRGGAGPGVEKPGADRFAGRGRTRADTS